jgi:hypothetical protein
MSSLRGFNANDYEPKGEYKPLPSGKYEAVITNSELRENRSQTGSYLLLTFQIVTGDYTNRLVWARLNLEHPNPTVVKIAQEELAAICRALNVLQPEESTDLHDMPLIIHVRCRKREDNDEITNEIKGYSAKVAPSAVSSAPPQAQAATPPWRR